MAEVVKNDSAPDTGWADLLADGRLPRFALIMLGVWLNAADSLVTATIMPSVGADLGGYAYFSWATAGYFVGAILADLVKKGSTGFPIEPFLIGRFLSAASRISTE